MSTSALPATASTPASRRVAAHWEEFLVGVGLLLASAAILPMVLAPSATAESEAEVYDPFSQPAWLLVGVLFLVAAARVLPQMTRAAMRNLPIVAFCYLALVSTLWSDDPASTLERAIDLCFGAAFGLYIGVRFGIEGLVRILGWLTLGILVLSVVFAVALPTYGLDAFHEESWRGVFGTKNELGRMMLVGAVVWAIRGFAREISASRAVVIVSAFAVVGFLSQARTRARGRVADARSHGVRLATESTGARVGSDQGPRRHGDRGLRPCVPAQSRLATRRRGSRPRPHGSYRDLGRRLRGYLRSSLARLRLRHVLGRARGSVAQR